MTRPLRIGIVSQSYYPVLGGVTEHIHGLAKALLGQGHSVTIITGKGGPRGTRAESLTARDAEQEIRAFGGEVLRVGRTRRLRWNGATVAVVGGWRLHADLGAIPRDRFDLLHLHSPFEPVLPLLAARHFNAPRVATFHSAGRSDRGYRLLRRVFGPLSASLSARIAVSHAARDFVAGVFPGKYRVVPNGVDVARFRAGRDAPNGSSARRSPRILYVGRLDPRKGLETLLDALARLDRETWELDVVGSGPLASTLKRRARREHLPIQFHGAASTRDLTVHYRAADLAVAPAEYGESFGVCLLEAMAAGVPLLASDLPGYREVVLGAVGDAEGAALLVPPGHVEAWTHALARALADRDLRRSLALSGSRRVARFDWAQVASEVERCYEDALRGDVLWPEAVVMPERPGIAGLRSRDRREVIPSRYLPR